VLGHPQQPGAVLAVAERRHRDVDGDDPVAHQVGLLGQHLVAQPQRDVEREHMGGQLGQGELAADQSGRHVRCPGHVGDVLHRDDLDPHRLPDPGGPLVPHAVRLLPPVLLAAGLVQVVRVVLRTDHEHVLGHVLEGVRDVCGER
jgi:hypothetical protein